MLRKAFPSAALVFAAALPALAADGSAQHPVDRQDCRYATSTATEGKGDLDGVLLPDNDVFRPLLADQREPRFYADYRRVRFRASQALAEGHGSTIDAALVAFGGAFGIWGLRQANGCDGMQISMFGAVFAQFNLDANSADLLNADYFVGPEMTLRRGPWSGRLRLYHQSSHLGDEFLLNYAIANGIRRQDMSLEIVDGLASLEDTWWRLYGGGGAVLVSGKDPDLSSRPGFFHWGLELRGPTFQPWSWLRSTSLRPVFGANFMSVQSNGWNVNTSLDGGLEWGGPSAGHRVRVLLEFQRGAVLFAQFFFAKTQNFGAVLQFEF
jgi:Protein of unknown function (DUF1207)